MPLTAGDKLGPYEILALIGAGGMGEVYKARDTRLDRTVAIKVSKTEFSERFEREARAVAALNHSNICTLHDVGPNYLVMEYIDGKPLKGPLPVDQTLKYAVQICDALDAAHKKGITHRDLKPANILLTKQAIKLLDFGLAKFGSSGIGPTFTPHDATITMALTGKNEIVGTLYYMSPEQLQAQANGQDIDARSDIFSFGLVLYEILTGRRAFDGSSPASVIAAIMERPAPSIVEVAPAALDRALKRCLAKDPDDRWQTARDLKAELEWIASGSGETIATSAPLQSRLGMTGRLGTVGWTIAAMLIVALGLVSFYYFRQKAPVPREILRLQIPMPEKTVFNYPILSPDGHHLAFKVTDADGRVYLGVREMETLEVRRLAEYGDASPSPPFWSTDSRFIAFQSQGKLKKVEISGGPVQVLCYASPTYTDGAWNSAGTIIFSSPDGGLSRVSSAGGAPSPLTTLDPARDEVSHEHPSFLPDGRHFVYSRISRRPENTGVYLGSLDAKPGEQESTQLMARQSGAVYVSSAGSRDGYLLFLRQRSLMAQRFDSTGSKLAGDPLVIAEPVGGSAERRMFSASATGVLAYGGPSIQGYTRLTWLDRQGKLLGLAGEGGYDTISLSHDGGRVAGNGAEANLWLVQFSTGVSTQLTFGPGSPRSPVWSPDGSQIVYTSAKAGPGDLYRKASSGAGEEETVFKSDQTKYPNDWSRDGHFLLFSSIDPKTKSDLWILPLSAGNAGAGKPTPFLQTDAYESEAVFSPDTRWVAYQSDASGMTEIYVRPFPAGSGLWQISHGGGYQARWRGDGKELFYFSGDGRLMAVEVTANPTFRPGVPTALFPTRIEGGGSTQTSHRWDVTADGQRFLINTVTPAASSPPITVVLNWEAGLLK